MVVTCSGRSDRRHRAIRVEMASARTVAKFAHRVSHRRRALIFRVRSRHEPIGVTPRAIRFVSGRRPRRDLGIARVTTQTSDGRSVIARIVPAGVRKADRCPRDRVVAIVALERRYKMRRRFAGRAGAVVARRA